MSKTKVIQVASQKGGVCKSTAARLIAVEYARVGWGVLIADMDIQQGTSTKWNMKRMQEEIPPEVSVEAFSSVDKALRRKDEFDMVIFDGAPHATRATAQIAEEADIIILPTGNSVEDMDEQIQLAHELRKKGIPTNKIAFVLMRVGESKSETRDAFEYLNGTPFFVFEESIQDKVAYRKALREGRVLTETIYKSLNKKAENLVQQIADQIDVLELNN